MRHLLAALLVAPLFALSAHHAFGQPVPVTGGGGGGGGGNVNITEVGGVTINLGQATMSGSLPVAIASNQSSVPVTASQATGTNLHMVCDAGCSSSTAPADESSFTFGATSQTPIGGVYQTTATSNPLSSGQMGALQLTEYRAAQVNLRTSAGVEEGNSTTPLQVTGANGTFPASQSGTWTVQPGNTANTTPWLATINQGGNSATVSAAGNLDVAVNLALPAGSNIVGKVDLLGNTGAAMDFAGQNAASPPNAMLGGCQYNSSPTTITSGNASPVQCDNAGDIKVNVVSGGTVAQGSTTSGQGGSLVMGAVTTAAPSLTSGQTNALSVDLNGGLRTAMPCNKVVNIAQTATTDIHTFTGYGYVCSIVLVSATAQNIGLREGTGTTCGTGPTSLIGDSSGTPEIAVAANGGFSSVSGTPWLRLQVSADHLCVEQSGTGEVAGTITYSDLAN